MQNRALPEKFRTAVWQRDKINSLSAYELTRACSRSFSSSHGVTVPPPLSHTLSLVYSEYMSCCSPVCHTCSTLINLMGPTHNITPAMTLWVHTELAISMPHMTGIIYLAPSNSTSIRTILQMPATGDCIPQHCFKVGNTCNVVFQGSGHPKFLTAWLTISCGNLPMVHLYFRPLASGTWPIGQRNTPQVPHALHRFVLGHLPDGPYLETPLP
jgi:hypothetical protein